MPEVVLTPGGKRMSPVATKITTAVTDSLPKEVRVPTRQEARRAENEEYLRNPNVKAMLAMIGKAEGGDYHAKFGWLPGYSKWSFTDESTHPGAGIDGKTTAAGLYQINNAGWTEHAKKAQGLTDFSPHTQDLSAVEAMRFRRSLDDVIQGNLSGAVAKLKKYEWSSFQTHSYKQLEAWFIEAGGTVK